MAGIGREGARVELGGLQGVLPLPGLRLPLANVFHRGEGGGRGLDLAVFSRLRGFVRVLQAAAFCKLRGGANVQWIPPHPTLSPSGDSRKNGSSMLGEREHARRCAAKCVRRVLQDACQMSA